jgi:cytochrome c5
MRLSRPGTVAALLMLGAWHAAASQNSAPAQTAAPTQTAAAAQNAAPAQAAAHTPAGQPIYYPSMGDLMTMLVQPRHTKLGLAGRAQNWTYAAYELNELRNAFGRIAHTIPTYRTMDTEQMVTAIMERPLNALDHAIIAADAARFAAAYEEVTQACNACHAGQQHAMVVIKVPDRAAFPDQDFRASHR